MIGKTEMNMECHPVLFERRNRAEQYMRAMAMVQWRATEDITWSTKSDIASLDMLPNHDKNPMVIRAGRLYRGVPYSFAGLSAWNFYQYFGPEDTKGFPTVSGITWKHLNGSSTKAVARVGNDCSGTIQMSWEQVGANILLASTGEMTRNRGYLPVGDYEADSEEFTDTVADCEKNGNQTMFAAYELLQKADVVVRRQDGAGHTMMVTSVQVVRNEDGTIDGGKSYITVLHQVSFNLREQACHYDEALGENVYHIYGIDDPFTFDELFEKGYLPVTCDVLTDPKAQKEIWFKDSQAEQSFEGILKGTFSSSRPIAFVTVTITEPKGTQIMKRTCFNPRQCKQKIFDFQMNRFEMEPEFLMMGDLDLKKLTPGFYRCTHVLTDIHGVEHTMRDFDFTV